MWWGLQFALCATIGGQQFSKVAVRPFYQPTRKLSLFYIFTKTPTKDLERNFSVWADELREISDTTDATLQKKRLDAFVVEKFQKNMTSKVAELTDAMKRYTLQSMQQYQTRYLLA